MPRHPRGPASVVPAALPLASHHHHGSVSSNGSSGSPHNSGYGLIQPLPLLSIPASTPPPTLPRHHHKRGSASRSLTPPWTEWDIDLNEWKEKGLGFGKDVGDKIGGRFPGVRYSAEFFTALRTNIALSAAITPPELDLPSPPFAPKIVPPFPLPTPPPSPIESSASAIPSSPSAGSVSVSSASLSPLSEVQSRPRRLSAPPQPSIHATSDSSLRAAALHLIAATVAAQREVAAHALVDSPVILTLLGLFITLIFLLTTGALPFLRYGSMSLALTSCLAVLAAAVALARRALSGYDRQARGVDASWLGNDEVIIAHSEGEVIAALVIRTIQSPPGSQHGASRGTSAGARRRTNSASRAPTPVTKRRSSSTSSTSSASTVSTAASVPLAAAARAKPSGGKKRKKKSNSPTAVSPSPAGGLPQTSSMHARGPRTTYIRAWAVSPSHRNQGLGHALLRAAVDTALSHSCADVVFGPAAAVEATEDGAGRLVVVDRAGTGRVLPEMEWDWEWLGLGNVAKVLGWQRGKVGLNEDFEKVEAWAAGRLEAVKREVGGKGR